MMLHQTHGAALKQVHPKTEERFVIKKGVKKAAGYRAGKGEGGRGVMTSSDAPITVTANDLRRLAERADGLRERDWRIVLGAGEEKLVLEPAGDESGWPNVIVRTEPAVEVDSMNKVVPDMTGMGSAEEVELYWSKSKPPVLLVGDAVDGMKGDSVFWSQAAVEKFLIPYYTRFLSDKKLLELRTLSRDRTVIALIHREPTIYESRRTDGLGEVLVKPRPELVILRVVGGKLISEAFHY